MTARIVSLSLIAIGTFALIVAMREYRKTIDYLWSDDFREIAGMERSEKRTPLLVVAVCLQ